MAETPQERQARIAANQPRQGDALDLTDPKDQAALRAAARKWPKRFSTIDEAKKARWVRGLEVASDIADAMADVDDPAFKKEAASIYISVAKTGAALEKMNQEDDHLQEKYERIDGGKATEAITPIIYRGVSEDDI